MALALEVPKAHRLGLRWLAKLPEEAFRELARTVPTAAGGSFSSLLTNAVREADRPQAHALSHALVGLAGLQRQRRDQSSEEIAASVAAAMEGDLQAPGEVTTLQTRLQECLSWRSLRDYERAADLLEANAHLLWDTRILSDIRPLFTDQEPLTTNSALVLHTLQLQYWDGDRLADFYAVMDRGELYRLQRMVQRALGKDAILAELLNRAGLTRVGTETDEDDSEE